MEKIKFQYNKPINILCESYRLKEQIDKTTGSVESVFLEGIAITFDKPTRNRVSYTQKSGIEKHKTLVGKPFLDTHHDDSIHTHPPFGHVVECYPGTNPKNNLPCLKYKVDLDPEEKVFIRKAKRGDLGGTSIQVLVDNVIEKEDAYGTFIEANIREYLELSAVLIPGDGDTTMALAEKFNKIKTNLYKEVRSSNGVITPDGILPQRKVLGKEQEPSVNGDKEEDKIKPLMDLPDEMDLGKDKIYNPKIKPKQDDIDLEVDAPLKLVGGRRTEVAYKGCNCPSCGMQMLKDNYSNGFQLRCWACDYRIEKVRR